MFNRLTTRRLNLFDFRVRGLMRTVALAGARLGLGMRLAVALLARGLTFTAAPLFLAALRIAAARARVMGVSFIKVRGLMARKLALLKFFRGLADLALGAGRGGLTDLGRTGLPAPPIALSSRIFLIVGRPGSCTPYLSRPSTVYVSLNSRYPTGIYFSKNTRVLGNFPILVMKRRSSLRKRCISYLEDVSGPMPNFRAVPLARAVFTAGFVPVFLRRDHPKSAILGSPLSMSTLSRCRSL